MIDTIKDKIRAYWDVALALLVFLAMLLVPHNNIQEQVQHAVFTVGAMVLAVALSFQGFVRMSRYALSRRHPVADYFLNILIIVGPFFAMFLSPLWLFVVIGLHILSHWRSPDPEGGSHGMIMRHGMQFVVFLIGIVIYLSL